MAKDHYVARTYLRHFGDDSKGGMLNGYQKPNGTTFSCWPKDVCHEWDGDLNPSVLERSEILGDYRKIFEPNWNPAIEDIVAGKMSATDKFIVSAYMANLMVCTPAWRRVASAILEHNYKSKAMFKQEMNEKHGVKDEMFAEGIDMLKRGELRPVADPGRVKAMMTGQLLSFACTTYNLEWLLVENLTEIPFATSDNPVAMDYPGPKAPVTRMLPITPSLCMSVTYPVVAVRKLSPEDVSRILRTPPAGEIRRARAKPSGVRYMNKLIVQCAEDQVFSSRADDGMGELVKKYGKFGMDAEFSQLRKLGEPNAIYQGVSICVRERAQQA